MTTLLISNEKMENSMKIVQYLEEFELLTKSASKAYENDAKCQQKNTTLPEK